MLNVPNYFDVKQTPSYYILSAYGTLSANGKLDSANLKSHLNTLI
jgi:hypothetical protein